MRNKNFYIILLILILTPIISSAQEKEEVTFGWVIDGPVEAIYFDPTKIHEDPLVKEIKNLLETEYEVRFPPDKILIGDWTRENVKENLDQLLNDPDVDFVLCMGLIASDVASHRTDLRKPVIAPIVLDSELQNLPRDGASSGVKNLNYLISVRKVPEALATFAEVFNVKNFAVLSSKYFLDAIPALKQWETGNKDLRITTIPVSDSVEEAVDKIPQDVLAVMITPLDHLPYAETIRLIDILNAKDIATFSYARRDVENGALLSDDAENVNTRLTRRIALNVQRILMDEEPGSLPVDFRLDKKLVLNMETARKIGYTPPFTVIWESELLNQQEEEVNRKITIFDAVEEALDKNLELLSKELETQAGEKDIQKAWANLLPQLEASALGVKIDEDRAMMGNYEETYSGSLSLTQVIFSEEAIANLAIQKILHTSREAQLEQVKQDIILATATAYLNVLQTRAYERIQKENLSVTRSNLELAQIRQNIGDAGPGEVYRWEYELASKRTEVFKAENMRKQAEIQLNRLLHRPQEEPFATVEIALDDPNLVTGATPIMEYLDDSVIFRKFRDFAVQFGLENSPELQQIDAGIAARERALTSVRNAFYLPTVAVQGEVTKIFEEKGAGAPIPGVDDTNWQVAIQATLPLFSGGSKLAGLSQTKMEVRQLEIERQNVAEKIEQRIRAAVYQTGNSHARIKLAFDAAETAQKTLELVTDAYGQGVASNLDLIDAQNSALISDLGATNAIYQFLLDLMEAQRAVCAFDFIITPEDRSGFFEEFEKYLGKNKIEMPEEDGAPDK